MNPPTRYTNLDAARALFGERVDRLAPFLMKGDPLADAAARDLLDLPHPHRTRTIDRALAAAPGAAPPEVPQSLLRLLAEARHVPFWVDFDRAERGGAALLRAGPLGGLVLGTYSLVAGYASPAGNKPLVFSGRLMEDAPRRLAETGRFVENVCQPGGMRPGGEGFAAAVKVRLIHASVRSALQRSERWDEAAWGTPVNQVDMAGTVLLFSYVLLDGLSRLGHQLRREERESLLHLWRYTGHVLGVHHELLSGSEDEARTLWQLLRATQGPPDEDSRALTRALMESGEATAQDEEERALARRMRPLGYAVSRHLVGEEYARLLGYPPLPPGWRLAVPLIRRAARGGQLLARLVPGGQRVQASLGKRYWRQTTEHGLRGLPVAFPLPELKGASVPVPEPR